MVSEVANSRYHSLFFILGGGDRHDVGRGGRGGTRGHAMGTAPSHPPHLLLNFSGYFSRMTWKRWAMEASWGVGVGPEEG